MQPILLPTAYLPPISWFAALVQSESAYIEINETYPKQTFRNRCNIYTASGILSLTVPVNRVNGNHTRTCDIKIDNTGKWQLLHWRSIVTAYNKSPYFLYYRDLIEPVYQKEHEYLIHLNQVILTLVLKALRIKDKEILFTLEYDSNPDFPDLRNSFSPKTGQYQGITIQLPRYMQAFEERHGFIPDLSILDLLFNLGPDALIYLKNVPLVTLKASINAPKDIQS